MIRYEGYKRAEELNFDPYKLAKENILVDFDTDYYGNYTEQTELIEVLYLQIKEAAVLNVSFVESTRIGYKTSEDGRCFSVSVGHKITLNWKRIAENAKQLKALSVGGNISEIPESVFEISQLKILDLSASNIAIVPQEICLLKSLEILRLDSTKIKELSEQITSLEKLQYLDISRTNICELPSHIKKLKNLSVLKISCNAIKDLPEDFKELSELEYLGMNFTQVTSIPQSILELRKLKTLNLGATKISSLPENLRMLKKLENLIIWGTRISVLPEWVTDFVNLHTLFLRDNQNIKSLPENIGDLKKLEILDIQNTAIETLPDSISNLKNMMFMELGKTQIHKLPDFSKMKKLILVNLDEMVLERIPDSLIRKELPVSLEKYDGITMRNTTLRCQPISLFSHDYAFIKAYYDEEKIHLNETKVVFLGDGEAGKSHIIERIFHEGEKLEQFTKDVTPGIEISKKLYRIGDEDVNLQFWDFGGQEIMHSMHRFFLTERTLYVIVLNSRDNTQDERAQYWLNNVKSFANGCPVIMILNKIDQNRSASLNERLLKSDYPDIVETIKMSALEDEKSKFDELVNIIMRMVKEFDSYAMDFPKSWNCIKERLTDMDSNYIVDGQYRDICKENGVEDEQIQNWLLDWFHDLGVSFNYRKRDELLGGYMVLRPQWITNAIYIILFSGSQYAHNGIIRKNDIIELLKNPPRAVEKISYSINEVPYILGVMRRFDISYRLSDDAEFIPMLCDKNEHEDAVNFYNDSESLEFFLEYKYLPNNVLHKLIIKMCDDIDMDKIWLTGVILKSPDNLLKALVRMHNDRLEIFIKSEDELLCPSRGYLHTIRNNLQKINEELNLERKEWIVYKENGKKDEISYEKLVIYLSSGEKEYFSTVFRKKISINKILNLVEDKDRARFIEKICQENPQIELPELIARLNTFLPKNIDMEQLKEDIISYCGKMQSNLLLVRQGKENDRNTYLKDLLEAGRYEVKDQTLCGISPGGKAAGELDILVSNKEKQPVSLVEALNLSSLNQKYLSEHIDKVFIYDRLGMRCNLLISYVDVADFSEFYDKYKEFVKNYDYKYALLRTEAEDQYTNIRVIKTVHNREEQEIFLYHVLVYLQDQ